jgi:hypothetical protein
VLPVRPKASEGVPFQRVRSAQGSDEAKYYRFSSVSFPKLESDSLRDSRAFFVLDQNISTGCLLCFNVPFCGLRVANVLSLDHCGLRLWAIHRNKLSLFGAVCGKVSKFLVNVLI